MSTLRKQWQYRSREYPIVTPQMWIVFIGSIVWTAACYVDKDYDAMWRSIFALGAFNVMMFLFAFTLGLPTRNDVERIEWLQRVEWKQSHPAFRSDDV